MAENDEVGTVQTPDVAAAEVAPVDVDHVAPEQADVPTKVIGTDEKIAAADAHTDDHGAEVGPVVAPDAIEKQEEFSTRVRAEADGTFAVVRYSANGDVPDTIIASYPTLDAAIAAPEHHDAALIADPASSRP